MQNKRGIFYGVGIGPGDPELITVKAMRALSISPVIAAPRTNGGDTIALDIVREVITLNGKRVLPMDFIMEKDIAKRMENYRKNADAAASYLDQGQNVAMVTLGDVSIYSTVHYIADELMSRGYETVMVPGVASFSAVAASMNISLTEMDKPLHIIPTVWENPENYLSMPGTKVLMKAGRHLRETLNTIDQMGLLGSTSLAINCGMEDEVLLKEITADTELPEKTGYFTTIIVKDKGK